MARIVLVGCGTFDETSRDRLEVTIEARTGEALRAELRRIEREIDDPDLRLATRARLLIPVYSHDALESSLENEWVDARGNRESWQDMLRLQRQGRYPRAFRSITAPILMLHGSGDPHPGSMIRDGLLPHLPQLEYEELERCGHYPWLERAVREKFFARLTDWLSRLEPGGSSTAAAPPGRRVTG